MNDAGPNKADDPDTTLRIRQAGYDDAGSYVCTATSVLGQTKEVLKLSVESKYFTMCMRKTL